MGEEVGTTSGVQFSLINSLRTGNFILDTAIAFLIPTLLQRLTNMEFSWIRKLLAFIKTLFKGKNYCYERNIIYTEKLNNWGDSLNRAEERNHILQKAISLYVAHSYDNKKLEKADFSLTEFSGRRERSDSDYDYNSNRNTYKSPADQLSDYSIVCNAEDGLWIKVTEDIELMFHYGNDASSNEESEGSQKKEIFTSKRSLHLRSAKANGAQLIDKYVQEAYDWYVKRVQEANNDKDIYMYMAKFPEKVSANSNGKDICFKRFKLSEEKTFKSLFFKEKEDLLQLFEHFENKTSKYGISGYPHKLGLLLHGPPGTGKTSLIKALAAHMKRNIVSVPLSKIETNAQLMDLVFGHDFSVKGEDVPVKLGFSKTIFVFEDIDCASKVVHKRTSEPEVIATPTYCYGEEKEGNSDTSYHIPKAEDESDQGLVITPTKKLFEIPDALNLSGILNVLDGIVDCPDRVVVMTTNHPEKLDPALIRPGRIDKILKLGYMDCESLEQLIKHYFVVDSLTAGQKKKLYLLIEENNMKNTPAEMEQLCVEHESVDEFIAALHDKLLLKDREF